MIQEIPKEVAMLEDIEDATSEHVLLWVHRVEAQKTEDKDLTFSGKICKRSSMPYSGCTRRSSNANIVV